jgi:glycosyltransferase involved in cell wall biosynthesis
MADLCELVAARQPSTEKTGTIRVGFLGRLSPEKGAREFVKMARDFTEEGYDATWVIAGDGPERAWIEERYACLIAKGNLKLLGEIDDVRSFLRGIDILVMASTNEGLPYSLLEAMASGCAVAAYAVGGVSEVIRDSSLGLLASPQDYRTLKAHVGHLLNSPVDLEIIAAAGSAHVRAHFALRNRRATIEELYNSASCRDWKGGRVTI